MLISREKRKTNIAEYILYMWQVEDTIRAFDFNIERLDRELIGKYGQPDHIRQEIRDWYENIATHMKNEKVEHSGHVQFIRNIIAELYNFHQALLKEPGDTEYSEIYFNVLPLIREMNSKQKWTSENEIETCLNTVYIYLMMRLRKDQVSPETEQAINLVIRFLAMLSARFKTSEDGEWTSEKE
jgi:hypothetical protein